MENNIVWGHRPLYGRQVGIKLELLTEYNLKSVLVPCQRSDQLTLGGSLNVHANM